MTEAILILRQQIIYSKRPCFERLAFIIGPAYGGGTILVGGRKLNALNIIVFSTMDCSRILDILVL